MSKKRANPTVVAQDAFQRQYDEWMRELGPDALTRRKEPPEAEVVAVQFGLLSGKDVLRLSAVEVTHAVTQKTGVVQRGGATESRLGTSSRSMLCSTCGCAHEQCAVGHSGHIALRMPVPNGEYLTMLMKILECVCVNCCRLKLPSDFPAADEILSIRNDKERMKRLFTWCRRREVCESWKETKRRRKIQQRASRNHTSYEMEEQKLDAEDEKEDKPDNDVPVEELLTRGANCNARQPYWIKDDGVILRPVWSLTDEDRDNYQHDKEIDHLLTESKTRELTPDELARTKEPRQWVEPVFTPEDMLRILENIPDSAIKVLGLNPEHSHPSSLMWTNFYVPTVNIRPSKIGRSGNNRCPNEDDLTLRLKGIERHNLQLAARLKKEEKKGSSGDTVINLSKYFYQNREFDTADAAFAAKPEGPRPQGRPPKAPGSSSKQAVTSYLMYDRLYRSCTSYQNSKLKGKGITQYGKDKKSLRCRFKGPKNKNRVRGTV